MAENKKKLSRRSTALLILAAVAIIIGTLIYYEQISLLYVLTSLALMTLLVVVGFSDLEGVQRIDPEVPQR